MIKKIDRIILFTIFVGLFSLFNNPILSQNKNKVEVKKEYEKDLTKAKKSTIKIDLSDSSKNFNLNIDYKIFDRKVKDLYDFTPIPSTNLGRKMEAQYPTIIAKGSFVFPLETNADIFFQPKVFNEKQFSNNSLTFNFFHKGNWHKNNLVEWDNNLIAIPSKIKSHTIGWDIGGGAQYSHYWEKGELEIDAFYKRVHSTYYGLDKNLYNLFGLNEPDYTLLNKKNFLKNNLSHSYNQGGINLNIKSSPSINYDYALRYNLSISYVNTSDNSNIASREVMNNLQGNTYNLKLYENYLKISSELGPTIGKYSMVTIGINSESALYGSEQDFNSSLLDIYASYKLRNGGWSLDLGAKGSLSFNNKDGYDKYHTYLFPKVAITYALKEDRFWAYANVEGGNSLNSYSSLLEKNVAVFPGIEIRESSIPIIGKVGIKGLVTHNLSAEIYVGAAKHKGLIQLLNSANRAIAFSPLNAIYSNHREAFIGGSIVYNNKSFEIGAEAKLTTFTKGQVYRGEEVNNYDYNNNFNRTRPLGYAPFEGHIYTEYNFRERIYIGADLFLRSRAYVSPIKIESKGYAKLGGYFKYVINNYITAFCQINNALNADIQNYGMYLESKRNIGFGLLVKF